MTRCRNLRKIGWLPGECRCHTNRLKDFVNRNSTMRDWVDESAAGTNGVGNVMGIYKCPPLIAHKLVVKNRSRTCNAVTCKTTRVNRTARFARGIYRANMPIWSCWLNWLCRRQPLAPLLNTFTYYLNGFVYQPCTPTQLSEQRSANDGCPNPMPVAPHSNHVSFFLVRRSTPVRNS